MNDLRAAELGTIVRLADGRIGTTVYNGLDGVGIKWGRHILREEDFEGTTGDCFVPDDGSSALEPDWPWVPDAMLRDEYARAKLPCVGDDYEVIE